MCTFVNAIKSPLGDQTGVPYKPLPKELRLGFSDIHDIGIFAKEGIAQGTNLGMTHIKVADHLIRTPLGGFLNHSDNANCIKAELRMFNEDDPTKPLNYKKWNLVTIKDIEKPITCGEYLIWRFGKAFSYRK